MTADAASMPAARPRRRLGGIVAMLVLGCIAVGGAVLLLVEQVDQLRAQEQARWEERLSAVARQQRDLLQQTGDAGLAALAAIPESPTIGLFLTEYRAHRGDFDRIMDGPQQLDYIRNYLAVVAADHGYQTGDGPPAVRANLPGVVSPPQPVAPRQDLAEEPVDTTSLILREFAFEGIALVNLSGDVIVATDEFPPLTYAIRNYIATAVRGERHVSIAFDAPDGRPTHVSLYPAHAYLDTETPEAQLAWVVGLRLLEEVFDTTLPARLGVDQYGVESVAVHRTGEGLRQLSPAARDGAGGAPVRLPDEAPAWALALESPGTVGVVTEADGRRVLTASASFDELPVSIVSSIPVDEATAGLDGPVRAMTWLLAPVILLAVAGVIVAWAVGQPRRA